MYNPSKQEIKEAVEDGTISLQEAKFLLQELELDDEMFLHDNDPFGSRPSSIDFNSEFKPGKTGDANPLTKLYKSNYLDTVAGPKDKRKQVPEEPVSESDCKKTQRALEKAFPGFDLPIMCLEHCSAAEERTRGVMKYGYEHDQATANVIYQRAMKAIEKELQTAVPKAKFNLAMQLTGAFIKAVLNSVVAGLGYWDGADFDVTLYPDEYDDESDY